MHVCDVTMLYAAESGGVRRYLDTKSTWLRQRSGFRHTLVIPAARRTPCEPGTLALRSVPLAHGYRVPVACGEVRRKLLKLRPGLIEAGDPYHLAWVGLAAARALGVPAVAFCHSDLPAMLRQHGGRRAARLAEHYLRRLYRHFDLVLAPSAAMTARLRSWGIAQTEHQRLGVDLTTFHPTQRDPDLRARLNVAARSRLLVYSGRFAPEKNLPVLFQALRLLGDDYSLLLIGAGSLPAAIPSNVRVLPFVRDRRELAALLAGCDLFVHAGDQETFGLAVLEAMACGLPVVATASPGTMELVSEEMGFLVPPRQPAMLAEAIRAVYERDRVDLGRRARAVAQRYDWDSVLAELLQRYRALCAAAPPSS